MWGQAILQRLESYLSGSWALALLRVSPWGGNTALVEKAAERATGRTAHAHLSWAVSFFFFSLQVRGPLAPPAARPTPRALPWGPCGHRPPVAAPPAGSRLWTWRRPRWELMELSRTSVVRTERRPGLGRCKHFFWLGVVFDTVGATVLFTGVFADLLFSDLLLYLGSIIIFLSLLWWIFWYTGNIELTTEETLKGPLRVPTARPLEVLSQTVSHRFFTIGNVPTTLLRMRQQRRRRRFLQKTASLSMTVSGQVEKQMEKEDQDRNGVKSVQESGDAQEICREGLSPKPEAVKSSEGIPTPCPGDCPLGPEAGLPMFIKRQSTHLVQPEFTSSSLDQPLHPAVLVSKSQPLVSLASGSQSPPITCVSTGQFAVPLFSRSQPLDILISKTAVSPASQSHLVPVAPVSHPLVPVASESHLLVPVASESHPLVPVASQSHPFITVASQSHLVVQVASQSHPLVPVATQSQLQNLSQASQTQLPPVQASQAQALATPPSVIHFLPTQSFQTQSVSPFFPPAVQDLQTLHHTQKTSRSSSLVQEISLRQSSSAQEFYKKPIAQAFETPADQKRSPEVPESHAPAAQAQQSVSPESAPLPRSGEERSSFLV